MVLVAGGSGDVQRREGNGSSRGKPERAVIANPEDERASRDEQDRTENCFEQSLDIAGIEVLGNDRGQSH